MYDNLDGNVLNIVMPNTSLVFNNVYIYPDKSRVRDGADYLAALYFGEALNFKVRYDKTYSSIYSKCLIIHLSFSAYLLGQ